MFKEVQVKDIFNRIGGFKVINCEPIVVCDEIFHYRNKMEFTFSNKEYVPEKEKDREPEEFALGLHAPGRWDKILNINSCHIQSKISNDNRPKIHSSYDKTHYYMHDCMMCMIL